MAKKKRMMDWANSTDPKHKDFDPKGGLREGSNSKTK